MITTRAMFFCFLFFCLDVGLGRGQQRPPATPLITHDPYFSIWSTTDNLTDAETTHWSGTAQPFNGVARVDGKPFRFMGRIPGRRPDPIPAMQQTAHSITPTHTYYEFSQNGIRLKLTFLTPAIMNDINLLSRPVTYLEWSAQSTDGATHKVVLLLDVDPVVAVNERGQQVVMFRNRTSRLEVLSVGSREQNILNRSGDNLRIDWGYFHVAVPKSESASSVIAPGTLTKFATEGSLAESDTLDMPQTANRFCPHLAVMLDLGQVSEAAVQRHLLVSYTESYAIQYFQRNLRPYWQRNDLPVEKMLDEAEEQYAALEQQGAAFDKELTADLIRVGGEHYAAIAVLAYRQALAAHKIVADVDGTAMMFPKENTSNGDLGTVDVIYPGAPLFLVLQPKLLEAQLRPVLEYAASGRWHFRYAPHDLGQYPLANGQVYGGGEKSEDTQMPVEECGNMLILLDALAMVEGDARLAEHYWPQLTSWASYLKEKGLDPENQLTTDDFAGHLLHNANLALKGVEGVAAYADLAHRIKQESIASEYRAVAKSMAGKWILLASEGDHTKLAYDMPNTWSQKYNLVWDKLLGFDLFPQKVRENEVAYYVKQLNKCGLPLDVRADYTKLDWSIWTAALATDPKQFQALIDPVYLWTNQTPDRVPLTDWYDTKTGAALHFQARSVVGGVYMKLFSDPALTDKWNKWSHALPQQ